MDFFPLNNLHGPVCIVPFSSIGLVVYHLMMENHIPVLGFWDNDPAINGKEYLDCPISLPNPADYPVNTLYIVCRHQSEKELTGQLLSLGISKSNILYAQQLLTQENTLDAGILDCINENAAHTIKPDGQAFLYPKETASWELFSYLFPKSFWRTSQKTLDTMKINLDARIPLDFSVSLFKRAAAIYSCVRITELSVNDISFACKFLNNIINQPLYTCFRIKIGFDVSPSDLEEIFTLLANNSIPIYQNSYHKDKYIIPSKPHHPYIMGAVVTAAPSAYAPEEDKNSCIFTHIHKNAGTSLKHYLFTDHTGLSHKYLANYKKENPVKFQNYFKFAIVRNPWDRLVAQYYAVRDLQERETSATHSYILHSLDLNLFQAPSFNEMILTHKEALLNWTYLKQYPFVCDSGGTIMADYIGRYEHLPESFEHIAKKIGVYSGKPIPALNRSKHKPYQEYYTPETREIVGNLLKTDIELFGYDFE